jgi:rhamnose utilization protein RhaD (predicted bifunctional aldolase and dehydrogenase)
MSNFDGPNREQFCTRRDRSDTPLQALQLMNDVQHFEAARALAQRMLLEGGSTPDDRIRFAYRTILARTPDTDELSLIKDELTKHEERFNADPEGAKKAITFGESKPKPELQPTELASYTLIANMLLNLDETVTRN